MLLYIRIVQGLGLPNAVDFLDIPDNGRTAIHETFVSAAGEKPGYIYVAQFCFAMALQASSHNVLKFESQTNAC